MPCSTLRFSALFCALAAIPVASAHAQDAFAPPCPQRAILAEAGDLARYKPGGRDVTDLVLQARITGMNGVCKPGPKRDITRVTIIVNLDAGRGPAATTRTADFSYFVAVMRGDDILTKQILPVHVEFPANSVAVKIQGNEVNVDLPTPKGITAADYRVIIGLQLSPDELSHNRVPGA